MKKFIVETYYTCTFKTVHSLNDLNESELSKIDNRTDGKVEVIDVKLNNRKTKKIGESNGGKDKKSKTDSLVVTELTNNISKSKKMDNNEDKIKNHLKIKLDLKCPIEEKDIFKKPK